MKKNPFKTKILGHIEQQNQNKRLTFSSYSLPPAPTLKLLIFCVMKIGSVMEARAQAEFRGSELLPMDKKNVIFARKLGYQLQ